MSEQVDPLAAAAAALKGEPVPEVQPPTEATDPPPAEPEGKPATEPAAEPQPEESKTQLYAQLTAKDKEIRALKKAAKGGSADELKALAAEDPARALEALGLDENAIFALWANKEDDSPAQPTEGEEAPWRAELEKVRTEWAEAKRELESYRSTDLEQKATASIGLMAQKDTERWELINKSIDQGSLKLAYQAAEEAYKETGEVPDMAEILDATEEKILEVATGQAKRWAETKKMQQFYGVTPPAEKPPTPTSNGADGSNGSRTLPNGAGDTPEPRELTEEERFAAALAAMSQTGA